VKQLSFDSLIPQDSSPEIWKPVVGYESLYLISNQGRVKHAIARGGRNNTRYQAGALKKISTSKYGYRYTSLTDDKGIDKKHYIHRLVMLAFCPIENSDILEVNHKDRIKANCSLYNLEWMDHHSNILHARSSGEAWDTPRGEDSGNAKLADDDIRRMRRLWDNGNGMQQIHIAKIFGVSSVCVSLIVRRKSWKHIE
jgi:hypothetical protein